MSRNYSINTYYEVNGIRFKNKSDAEDYNLKRFVCDEFNELFNNDDIYKDSNIKLNKNYSVFIFNKHNNLLKKDNLNKGYYVCDNNKIDEKYTYSSLEELYKYHTDKFKEIFKKADSIKIEYLSSLCEEKTIELLRSYKDTVKLLKERLKIKN